MEKPAVTEYDVLPLISHRWSPVLFSDRLVEKEKLLSVLEAARWAPSSYNEQPWSFLVATRDQPEEFQRLLDCLAESNVDWAQHCPVLMISVAKRQFDRNKSANRHAFHDVGLATENLMLQASSLGLFTHGMAGFDGDKMRETYHIPESHEPVAVIALGYAAENDQSAPEHLRKRDASERSRRPLRSFVFEGKWNQQATFVG